MRESVPTSPKLCGREYEKRRILEILLSDQSSMRDFNLTSIFVAGDSGVGKTALVRHVYNDLKVSESFDTRIWVCLFKMRNENMLLKEIVECVTHIPCGITELNVLWEAVKEELSGKKILLVLDDVENENESFWSNMRAIMDVGAKGSSLLVAASSRAHSTVTKALSIMTREIHYIYLDYLSLESRWSVFRQFGIDLPEVYKEQIVVFRQFGMVYKKQIVNKCGGIPLCIKMLCGLIGHVANEERIKGVVKNKSWEMDKLGGGVLPALRVCYDLLPTHLKQCLKYCSLFPKDFVFQKDIVVCFWASQGFIHPLEGREPEEIGNQYFDELFARSFFEHSPFHNSEQGKFVMHELVHGLAQHVAKNECFRSEDRFGTMAPSVRYFSFVPYEFQSVEINTLTQEISDLETFIVVNRSENKWNNIMSPVVNLTGIDDLLVKFQGLRVLDLSGSDIEELPETIQLLKSLRFLGLSNTRIKRLPPVIECLISLETMEAKNCLNLIELPQSLTRLLSLKHLDVKRESGFVSMPTGISRLTNLQTLSVLNVGDGSIHCSIGEIKNLDNVNGSLQIAGLENIKNGNDALEANLESKKFLKSLTFQWNGCKFLFNCDGSLALEVLENLKPNSNIEELIIRNYVGIGFPMWLDDSSFSKLASIVIDNCFKSTNFPNLGELPSLKFLSIRNMLGVKTLANYAKQSGTSNSPQFPLLELLNIREMRGLEELFEIQKGDFPYLHTLSISRCLMLKNIPEFPSLTELSFHFCTQLPKISYLPSLKYMKVEGFQKTKSLNLQWYVLPRLAKLEISHCAELLSVEGLSDLFSLEKLKITRCPKLHVYESWVKKHVMKRKYEVESGDRDIVSISGITNEYKPKMLDHAQKSEATGQRAPPLRIIAREHSTSRTKKQPSVTTTSTLSETTDGSQEEQAKQPGT